MRDVIIGHHDLSTVRASGLAFPARNTDVAFACVVWQDAERLEKLLRHVRPHFATVAVAVQESTDGTLEVARKYADIVVEDKHRGFGDATFGPLLLPLIKEPWTLKVDADEWPSENLLGSLQHAVWAAGQEGVKGVWIPFESSIDGHYWEEQHAHLRLFQTSLGWPPSLHSRPPVWVCIQWDEGCIDHSRTLDEMITDYLTYYRIGKGNPGWDAHNLLMMREACRGAASHDGWSYVTAHPWWPEVRDAAFDGKEQRDFMVVFAAGPSCSGTRMLYDMIGKLGLDAVHASLPGYLDLPPGSETHFDLANPVWWTPEEMVAEHGQDGYRWVIITRKQEFAAECAIKRRFVADQEEHAAYWARATSTLDTIENAYRLTYEDLVADPQGEFDKLADWLRAPHADVGTIFDGNAKYATEAPKATEAPRPARRPRRVRASR